MKFYSLEGLDSNVLQIITIYLFYFCFSPLLYFLFFIFFPFLLFLKFSWLFFFFNFPSLICKPGGTKQNHFQYFICVQNFFLSLKLPYFWCLWTWDYWMHLILCKIQQKGISQLRKEFLLWQGMISFLKQNTSAQQKFTRQAFKTAECASHFAFPKLTRA